MDILKIFVFSVNAILPLILLVLLGYLLKRMGVVTKEFVKIGNKVVFHVCLPILLFTNVVDIDGLSEINFGAVGYVMAIIGLLVILGGITAVFVRENRQKGVMFQCVFRSNFALIGVPLAELISGKEGVASAAILSVFTIPIYNILAVIVLTIFAGEKKNGAVAGQIKAIAKNPLIIGVVSGILVVCIKEVIPLQTNSFLTETFAFIPKVLDYLARMATPLALLVLGGQFEFSSVKGYRKQIVAGTVLRTIVAPLLGLGCAVALQLNGVLAFPPSIFGAFISLFGTPVAVSSAIMAEAMENDGQLAAQLVVWTSLLSMLTLFVCIFLCRMAGVV